MGRPVSQTPVEIETPGREGQLVFRKGFRRRTKVLVSASLTPEAMAAERAAVSARRKALLDEAQRAFAVLNVARYAASGDNTEQEDLDGTLRTGLRLLRVLRFDHFPAVRAMRAARERWAG